MLHWLLDQTAQTAYSFLLVSVVLVPVGMRVTRFLDPRTPGGYGELPGPDGQPLHMWFTKNPDHAKEDQSRAGA